MIEIIKLFFALALVVGVLYILSKIATYLLYELETTKYLKTQNGKSVKTSDKDKENQYLHNEYRVVEKNVPLKKADLSVSKAFKPKDANKVQNLHKKYNVGTYRGSDGRFKSLSNVKS